MLTLSQTGSLFKPRKAYLPQELLGKVQSLENLVPLSHFVKRDLFFFLDIITDLENNHIRV